MHTIAESLLQNKHLRLPISESEFVTNQSDDEVFLWPGNAGPKRIPRNKPMKIFGSHVSVLGTTQHDIALKIVCAHSAFNESKPFFNQKLQREDSV